MPRLNSAEAAGQFYNSEGLGLVWLGRSVVTGVMGICTKGLVLEYHITSLPKVVQVSRFRSVTLVSELVLTSAMRVRIAAEAVSRLWGREHSSIS